MKQMPEELVDQLFKGCEKRENLLGREELLVNLQKAVMERALAAEDTILVQPDVSVWELETI